MATRRSVRLVNDKRVARHRLARKKPRISIWATIEFSPIWHGVLLVQFFGERKLRQDALTGPALLSGGPIPRRWGQMYRPSQISMNLGPPGAERGRSQLVCFG